MSMPSWNWKAPGPLSSVRSVGGPAKIVRGSPKLPRTGWGRSNGLTGQPYAYEAFDAACADPEPAALPATASVAAAMTIASDFIAAPARRSP